MCKKCDSPECTGECEEGRHEFPELVVLSDSVLGFVDGEGAALAEDVRRESLAQVRAGELTELEFECIAFLAKYPNSNYLRFRDEDLERFASSFKGQPFLRNHDVYDIGSRDGTIVASSVTHVNGTPAFRQRMRVTTQRGMEDFLQGRVDRFSIGWYYDDVVCSVCNQRWFECSHMPGRRYKPEEGGREQLCELVFVNPLGKETSAVNAPAVRGTRVLGAEPGTTADLLSVLSEVREEYMKKKMAGAADAAEVDVEIPQDALEADAAEADEEEVEEVASEAQVEAVPAVPAAPAPAPAPVPAVRKVKPQAAAPVEQVHAHVLSAEQIAEMAAKLAQQMVAQKLASVDQLMRETQRETQRKEIEDLIARSGLSEESREAVRFAAGDLAAADRAWVEQLLATQRKVEARAHDAGVVHGLKPFGGPVTGVLDSLDKFKLAFEGLLDGSRPAQGVRPLSGIREAYLLLSGDHEMTGVFHAENVGLANINTTTMADLMTEYMNKRIVRMFQEYDRFWEPLCQIEDFNNLHDVHWIIVGGIGELDIVKEGAAYTERSWTADTETAGWVKRGNYLGLTMEAIDKDDTRRLQQAPRALAQAAWLSVGQDFTRIFTSNAGIGPTMRDTKALFHADHGNLGTTALSQTAWKATRLAMLKQTEEGSGSRLGGMTAPRYVMVPPDLEDTALTLFATERVTGSGNNDVNPYTTPGATVEARLQAARQRIIVNNFMIDATDWVAMADPALYPSIGLGYRFGRAPELFSAADPNSGLMFSNDVLPVKVRFVYSLGPIDWRGLYKHNVGG